MRLLLGLVLVFASSLTAGYIAPEAVPVPCGAIGTANDLMSTPEGCLIGLFTIKNFSYSSSGPGALPADQVPINAGMTGSGRFDFVLEADLVNSDPNNPTTYTIGYLIDPQPEIIKEFEVSAEPEFFDLAYGAGYQPALSLSAIQVNVQLCAGAPFTGPPYIAGNCPGEFHTILLDSGTSLTGKAIFTDPTNIVDVQESIELRGGSIPEGLRSSFVAIPEPGSAGLMAAGLLLLAARARRLTSFLR